VPLAVQGIIPALVTPFHPDERIDYSAWQRIIDSLIDAGVHGLFAGGSQGEFYSLDPEERLVALRFCKQAVAKRVPLYGNVGWITTRDTIRLAEQAEAEGVDVLVVVTPWYVQLSQQELADHFIAVCRSVNSPVMAYNFPQHGAIELAPETLAQIAASCENLVGIKDSSPNGPRKVAYKNCLPGRHLAVLAGPEHLILPSLEEGCAGAVTACANVAPRLFVELYQAFREGRHGQAARLHALACELGETNRLGTFPSVVKEAMRMIGLPAGPCRRPVSPVSENARNRLATVIGDLSSEGYLPKIANVHAQ
jgi:4-hydroxy-tetrahydrodipicolinate synthase